jgi:3-oxoacyl-[acyl-carrier protein] reductase
MAGIIVAKLSEITSKPESTFQADTRLIGSQGVLQSRELVELLIALEEYLEEKLRAVRLDQRRRDVHRARRVPDRRIAGRAHLRGMNTAIVTGASRGIGRYCAARLSEGGYRVVGLSRNPAPGERFETIQCDVSDPASVASAFDPFRRDKSLYALINAAGIASMNLLVTTPASTIRRIVETNLLGTIYCCQAAMPAFIRRGQGRIVNFSTIANAIALKGEAAYVASKAGVEGFSRSFAREAADHGVTVNTIAPGPIDTDLIAKVPPDKIDAIVQRQIIPRRASLEDVWNIVAMLLRPESASSTGEVIHVGGA